MDTTFTLAKCFGITPFDIFEQETDEVIMVINYYISKADDSPENNRANKKQERIRVNDSTATGGWY